MAKRSAPAARAARGATAARKPATRKTGARTRTAAAKRRSAGKTPATKGAASPKPGKVGSVKEYLAALPPDRRKAIEAVRRVVRRNLDRKYEEGVQYGMIGWYVPHRVYPDGYHCDPDQPLPFASLASQKNHMALYMFCIYGAPEAERRFRRAWAKTGKKLDMGKSCVRFKKLEDLALDVIGDAIKAMPAREFIAHYESSIRSAGKRRRR